MHFRHAILILLLSLAAITLAPAAPTPKRDWWLEIVGPEQVHYFVRVATGERRKVRKPQSPSRFDIPSPDGKWIATRTRVDKPKDITESIDVLHVRSTGQEGIGPRIAEYVSTARWTPDSKRIVYLSLKDGWRVFSSNPDGSDVRCLTQSECFVEQTHHLEVLTDGRVLHFGARKRVDFSFDPPRSKSRMTTHCLSGHLVISDGVRDRYICRDAILGEYSASPDLHRVAYVEGGALTSDLVIHDLRTDRSERIAVNGFRPGWKCSCSEIEWRPDGAALALEFNILNLSEFPKEHEPFQHIGIVSLEAEKPRVDVVDFGEWERNEKGGRRLGYSLLRWVTDAEVEADRGEIRPTSQPAK